MWPVARASQPVNPSLVVRADGLADVGKMPMPLRAHGATGAPKMPATGQADAPCGIIISVERRRFGAPLAQLDRALVYGTKGCWFESSAVR